MNPKEQKEYADIICKSFNENEIEQLENFSSYGFDAVERGVEVKVSGPLIIDRLKEYEAEGGAEE